jgi:hypothetical protein
MVTERGRKYLSWFCTPPSGCSMRTASALLARIGDSECKMPLNPGLLLSLPSPFCFLFCSSSMPVYLYSSLDGGPPLFLHPHTHTHTLSPQRSLPTFLLGCLLFPEHPVPSSLGETTGPAPCSQGFCLPWLALKGMLHVHSSFCLSSFSSSGVEHDSEGQEGGQGLRLPTALWLSSPASAGWSPAWEGARVSQPVGRTAYFQTLGCTPLEGCTCLDPLPAPW